MTAGHGSLGRVHGTPFLYMGQSRMISYLDRRTPALLGVLDGLVVPGARDAAESVRRPQAMTQRPDGGKRVVSAE